MVKTTRCAVQDCQEESPWWRGWLHRCICGDDSVTACRDGGWHRCAHESEHLRTWRRSGWNRLERAERGSIHDRGLKRCEGDALSQDWKQDPSVVLTSRVLTSRDVLISKMTWTLEQQLQQLQAPRVHQSRRSSKNSFAGVITESEICSKFQLNR